MWNFLKIFKKRPKVISTYDLAYMSKDDLEIYGRTLGIELDKRFSHSTLVNQIINQQNKLLLEKKLSNAESNK